MSLGLALETASRGRRLPGNRLHLQEGPIDLVIGAEGEALEVERAYAQAEARFDGLLAELVVELPLLRRPLGDELPPLIGPIARRMAAACWPYRMLFITPMAAVAGAVADSVLEALLRGRRLRKAYVNDGGDIAFFAAPGEIVNLGIVPSLARGLPEGLARIPGGSPVRGVATSGFGGRSLSRGIAQSVTVLASSAAEADAAATLIANAVDVEHPMIERRPAVSLVPDSDLGELPVTVAVGPLPDWAIAEALENGAALARRLRREGLIAAALLLLAGRMALVSDDTGWEDAGWS